MRKSISPVRVDGGYSRNWNFYGSICSVLRLGGALQGYAETPTGCAVALTAEGSSSCQMPSSQSYKLLGMCPNIRFLLYILRILPRVECKNRFSHLCDQIARLGKDGRWYRESIGKGKSGGLGSGLPRHREQPIGTPSQEGREEEVEPGPRMKQSPSSLKNVSLYHQHSLGKTNSKVKISWISRWQLQGSVSRV